MGRFSSGRPLIDDDAESPFGSGANPTLVLYSSDVDLPPGHGSVVVGMAGSGGSGGGTTTSAGSAQVTSSLGTGLAFNIAWDSSISSAPAAFKDVVIQVAQYYADHFADAVTVNLNVGYGEAGGYSLGSALGMSLTYLQSSSYAQIKSALTADMTTADDASAVASLLGDPTSGGNYWISTAEAKALGLLGSTSSIDGSVGFSSSAGIFDYNKTDGVSSGQYDFFGVVAHEFSEVMGRLLLVGGKIGTTSNSYDALDLFHYSATHTHDLSGTVAGYFSVDDGVTNLHNFNVSPLGGDRGDWASSSTPDAFDAFGSPGVAAPISASDLTALDAIGWNLASAAPPPTLPDLTVGNLAFGAIAGSGLGFSFNIVNAGATAAASSAGVYLSTDSTITASDTFIAAVDTAPFNSGGSQPESVLLSALPTMAPGTYYLGVIADSSNAVAESNENNNTAALKLILGDGNSNALTGTSGSDSIVGLSGNDKLTGSGGADTLAGGSGADHFVYMSKSDGLDKILDFNHAEGDLLDFSSAAFGTRLAVGGANIGELAAGNFVANASGSASGGKAQFIFNTTTHVLSFDSDGKGPSAAVQLVGVATDVTLTASDIHLT